MTVSALLRPRWRRLRVPALWRYLRRLRPPRTAQTALVVYQAEESRLATGLILLVVAVSWLTVFGPLALRTVGLFGEPQPPIPIVDNLERVTW